MMMMIIIIIIIITFLVFIVRFPYIYSFLRKKTHTPMIGLSYIDSMLSGSYLYGFTYINGAN